MEEPEQTSPLSESMEAPPVMPEGAAAATAETPEADSDEAQEPAAEQPDAGSPKPEPAADAPAVATEDIAGTPEEAEAEEPPSTGPVSWEDQLEESLSGSTLQRGELREGIILSRRDDGFVVDIGAKRDGFVPFDDLKEIKDREFNVGDEVAVVVTNFQNADGNAELSISQALLQEDWLVAEKLLESQEIWEGAVTGSNRGGLTVAFGRLRGFVPMSQLIGFNRIRHPAERQRRLQSMVDDEIVLKVIEVNRRRRRLILSQRAAAKEWRARRRDTLLKELEAGQVRRGRISQITDFGLFVNLGGMDGLVHISELSWGRIENPGEIYRSGQRVKVKVLNVDRDRERIALSIKALTPDPWESVVVRYQIGQLVQGRVTQVVDFGVFVELEPGIEGLLHNSELLDVAQRDELSGGDDILVKVIRIEPDRRRIGLSVRQVRSEEWEEWALARLEKEAEEEAAAEEAARAAAAKAEQAAAAEAERAAEVEAAKTEAEEAEEAVAASEKENSSEPAETEEASEEAPAEGETASASDEASSEDDSQSEDEVASSEVNGDAAEPDAAPEGSSEQQVTGQPQDDAAPALDGASSAQDEADLEE